ncbi:conserved hypothetical protein [Ricinus communis]|uniref:Uncharacterized protein n=1 Tax=Ricinus communis TaxID=3988 RepID=B9TLD1_RICCO|nr:conserved hypothetical protein [Ricinus communis]
MVSDCNVFYNRALLTLVVEFARSKGYEFTDGRSCTLDGAKFRLVKSPEAPEAMRKELRMFFTSNDLNAVFAFLELHPDLPGQHAEGIPPLEQSFPQVPRFPEVHAALLEVAARKGHIVTFRRFGDDHEMLCVTANVLLPDGLNRRYISESTAAVMRHLNQMPDVVDAAEPEAAH